MITTSFLLSMVWCGIYTLCKGTQVLLLWDQHTAPVGKDTFCVHMYLGYILYGRDDIQELRLILAFLLKVMTHFTSKTFHSAFPKHVAAYVIVSEMPWPLCTAGNDAHSLILMKVAKSKCPQGWNR